MNKTYKINYVIRVILIAILIAILYQFLNLVAPYILGNTGKSVVFGNNLPVTFPKNVVAVIKISNTKDGKITIGLSAILLPDKSQLSGKSICINNIVIVSRTLYKSTKNNLWEFNNKFDLTLSSPNSIVALDYANIPYLFQRNKFDFSEICSDYQRAISASELKIINPETHTLTFDLDPNIITPIYNYPFDRQNIQLDVGSIGEDGAIQVDIIGEVVVSQEWDASPKINLDHEAGIIFIGEVTSPELDASPTINLGNKSGNGKPQLEIDYLRPLSTRILTATLLLIILLTIVISVFAKDTSEYFSIVIGILLGLGGLHPILALPNQPTKTMIDGFFLSLYLLLGLTFVVRFVIFPLWNFTSLTTSQTKKNQKKK